jgi:hypothetical protein
MSGNQLPKFRIYPSIGVARVGNGPATQEDAVFSPEVPWANLFATNLQFLTPLGKVKKQAQRFYIYECDDKGMPLKPIDPNDFEITWSAEVANKKPFWYNFNNSLDLSIVSTNRNVSPDFAKNKIAPSICTQQRNPNVIDQGKRSPGGYDYRKELVNRPLKVSVKAGEIPKDILGKFPWGRTDGKNALESLLAKSMNASAKDVRLGRLEYDRGTLIFFPADGTSASLNASDLNTDFADNANWYDDICDGRITAKIVSKKTKEVFELSDAQTAAWIFTAPPDYAPQIQPISTMYDMVTGTSDDAFETDFSLIFPVLYRLYRMQWVNLGDFLAPSFKETLDELARKGELKYLFVKEPKEPADRVRKMIFDLFRSPDYPYNNEPIIPGANNTNIDNRESGKEPLKLPYYPGDGINYPGSPAQWFAIPPILYEQLRKWKDGQFKTIPPADLPKETLEHPTMDLIAKYYQAQYQRAAMDPLKKPLLMTRAVLETLYGGGFHPGVELTWPMRHAQIYRENARVFKEVTPDCNLFGLREIRINAATQAQQDKVFFNDFGLQMTAIDIAESLTPGHAKNWLWQITPGDLTKWMGIPWQSDAGSCQAVYIDNQYPIPAWWAANLPVHVLSQESYLKLLDPNILEETKRYIYGNRLSWLQTTNTGFIGYHAEGGYTNGLISMVYQWKKIGLVTGRKLEPKIPGIPEIVYVAFNGNEVERKDWKPL